MEAKEFKVANRFISPTWGSLTQEETFRKITQFIEEEKDRNYTFIIGTDGFSDTVLHLVTAIIIHRVGYGAIYFYQKREFPKVVKLKQRIFYETTLSLEMANLVNAFLDSNGFSKIPIEVHLDVGGSLLTKELIREVVGMVSGSGFHPVVKPDAYGATKVADRHSK